MGQKVKFKRRTTDEIDNLEIEDGALIYNVENGKTYMDYGSIRIPTGGGASGGIHIGDDKPEDPDTVLWITEDDSKTKASEVVDSLDGDATNFAPSVRAVNSKLNAIDAKFNYATEERIVGTYINGKPVYKKTLSGLYGNGNGLAYNVDTFIEGHGTMTISGAKRLIPYSEVFQNQSYIGTIRQEGSTLILSYIQAGVETNGQIDITLIYTKTTD